MRIDAISIGIDPPREVNVVIEAFEYREGIA